MESKNTKWCCLVHHITKNLQKATNRDIYILSKGHAAMKVLDSLQINSKLVWECHQSLVKLAERNRIQPELVPGRSGVDGNEKADELARQGSSRPLI